MNNYENEVKEELTEDLYTTLQDLYLRVLEEVEAPSKDLRRDLAYARHVLKSYRRFINGE